MVSNKVLIVVANFPPYASNAGGMLRAVGLVNYFAKKKWEVTVLTCKRYYKSQNFNVDPNVKIHSISSIVNYFDSTVSKQTFLSQLFRICRRLFFLFKPYVIDKDEWDCQSYYRSARWLILTKKIKNVIVTCPPHSLQNVGVQLKKEFGKSVRYILDYRDLLSQRGTRLLEKKNRLQKIRTCEKEFLKHPDCILVVSYEMGNYLKSGFNVNCPVLLVENGYNYSSIMDAGYVNASNTMMTVGYFGSVKAIADKPKGLNKNFAYIFDALRDIRIKNQIKFVFQGDVQIDKEYSREFHIEILPPSSVDTALEQMRKCDYLVNLYTIEDDADTVRAGKFYDYLFARKPILLCFPLKATNLRRFIELNKLGVVVDVFNPEDIKNKFEIAFHCFQEGMENMFNMVFDITPYSREKQYEVLYHYLSKQG